MDLTELWESGVAQAALLLTLVVAAVVAALTV
jgi:hypothetical protein